MDKEALLLEALPLIKKSARRLIGRLNPADYNVEDLQQDLALDLIGRLSRFDPSRGSLSRFVWVAAEHRVANLRKQQQAQRRDCRRNAWSLNEPITIGDDVRERGANLSANDFPMDCARPEAEIIELRCDLKLVLSRIEPCLAAVARTVMFDSVNAAADSVGSSRATIHRRIKVLQQTFTCAGLHLYISRGKPAHSRRRIGVAE